MNTQPHTHPSTPASTPARFHPTRRDEMASWGLTLLRITVGVIFIAHGGQKLFGAGLGGVTEMFAQLGLPLPAVSAYLATFTELLGGTAMTIKSVAASVGIDDVRYFHRAFLRETGVSPGQWRRERMGQPPRP